MPLIDLPLLVPATPPPAPVAALLREAARRIRRFRSEHRIGAFVTSDYGRIYKTLEALLSLDALAGQRFCEWGSGFGVVACLAAMLGFDAYGIEIEHELVEAAQQLADDFDLPVEFLHGSFIPAGAATAGTYSWLTTREATGYDDPGLKADECDLIFAYPWPDEETVIEELFERYAADGAVLFTYHDIQPMRLRKKSHPNGSACPQQ
jgi:hypothetical protein